VNKKIFAQRSASRIRREGAAGARRLGFRGESTSAGSGRLASEPIGMTAPSSAKACRMYVTLKRCDGGRHPQSVTVRRAGGGVFEAPTTSTIAHADDWRWGGETAGPCSILKPAQVRVASAPSALARFCSAQPPAGIQLLRPLAAEAPCLAAGRRHMTLTGACRALAGQLCARNLQVAGC
jgi:hypothetical protein